MATEHHSFAACLGKRSAGARLAAQTITMGWNRNSKIGSFLREVVLDIDVLSKACTTSLNMPEPSCRIFWQMPT